MPDNQEEEDFLRMQAASASGEASIGYLGEGVYNHLLSQFVECYV